jgi:anti-anti-sigma factor
MESKFNIDYSGNILKITITGRLDAGNSSALSNKLSEYKGKTINDMVFYVKNLEYISSAGIRVIVFAKQKIGENSKIYLIGANETVLDVINMTGLANFMIVQETY